MNRPSDAFYDEEVLEKSMKDISEAFRLDTKHAQFYAEILQSLSCEELTCTARMRGMYFFQRLLGFGPSINF